MDLAGHRIAITGATGFLGRYVVRAVLDRDAIPVGVVRNPDRVPELAAAGIELRRADLADPSALARGFAGCDAILSVAAMVSVGSMYTLRRKRRAAYIRTNVGGMRNVLEAAVKSGVKRIVHTSSANVYRDRRGPIREGAALHDPTQHRLIANSYSLSKAAAERLAWQFAAEQGLALTTLRPAGIFGAHDATLMPWVRRLLRPPVSLFPAFTRLQLVHAGDVAAAALQSLATDASIGQAYNVAGGDESLWEFANAWKAAGGRRPALLIPLPVPVRPLLDMSRIRRDLGWRPRSLREGLEETFGREAAAARQ
ncbi:MAG: NAD(P)-dependent oxidoreductase [bacterium]